MIKLYHDMSVGFQSPRGDFGFLKANAMLAYADLLDVSDFNPLAGILVF